MHCKVTGCTSTPIARCLCSKHYQQYRRGTLGKARPAAGTHQLCVRVPEGTKAQVHKLAKSRRVKPSDVVRAALLRYLS